VFANFMLRVSLLRNEILLSYGHKYFCREDSTRTTTDAFCTEAIRMPERSDGHPKGN